MPDIKFYGRLTRLVNRISFQVNGRRDTCVLSAGALREILTRLGIESECLHVRAAIHSPSLNPRRYGAVLG